ncbi:MAG TPA: YceI family protein [Fimbriimonadaceae bacterium]|nr:YceI family protein [Fimbriimonadaceae bacterium]
MTTRLLLATVVAGILMLPAPVQYGLDTNHSHVGFTIPMFGGLSQVKGKFTDVTVQAIYDEKNLSASSVTATVKATSIDTGIAKRDDHLRTADFFEVEKYPEITFKSSEIKKEDGVFVVSGDFTMHGVTKQVTIPFRSTGQQKVGDATVIGFEGEFTINRNDYGISYGADRTPQMLGNDVSVELSLLLKPATAK